MVTSHHSTRVMFVTNICPHYRVKTFELFAQVFNAHFLFFSAGQERYWDPHHGLKTGDFPHTYLRERSLPFGGRFTPGLIRRLLTDDYDVVVKCINGRFALPVTYLLTRLRRKPFVLWTGIWHHPQTLFHRFSFPLTRYIYHHADAIVTYGSHVKRYLSQLGVPPERIFIAHHATDNAVYRQTASSEALADIRERLELADQPVTLYVGRLSPEKGLLNLIAAVARLRKWRPVLMFVGAGEQQPILEGACRQGGVDARFVGYVKTEQLYQYYALAYVFVLPSVTTRTFKDPWGLVVNEAMNQSVPVIATDAVGAAAGGLVQHGESGLVVSERDVAALAAALQQLLADPVLRARLGQTAQEKVLNWDNARMVAGFQAAITHALERVE
jgi:glycosyltransferase involved in cell wall biosynthesis